MFVVKFAKAIKNNPKKSLAGAAVLAWAGSYARDKYIASLTLRAECESAVELGRQHIHPLDPATRMTVFLNPAANGGKAYKMYEKYAEPILHLAGYDVHLVTLRQEGEAKKLMSVVQDIDVIVCAGGDGTLTEIVTGLMRRPDKDWKKIPIGVIPLGKSNTLCRRLLPGADHDKQPHFVSAAATAITKELTTPVDVMQIDGSAGKTVYAVNNIRWGNYCDLQEKARKMWYFGPLKSYTAFLYSFLLGRHPSSHKFDISYCDPTAPPAFVEESPPETSKISGMSVLAKFFARLWPWTSSEDSTPISDVEEEIEEVMLEKHKLERSSIEFFAEANSHIGLKSREKASIKVTLESDSTSFSNFITKAPFTVKNEIHEPVEISEQFDVGTFDLSSPSKENDKQYISIDNDRYEAMDISVKLLPNCIKFVYNPPV